jgi:hypothetical protein
MARVILFGGGDGGGLIIGPNGIKPIPPWEPFILAQFKALNHLANAPAKGVDRGIRAELAEQSTRLVSFALNQIEARVEGGLDKEGGLIFLDVEDGFWCGNGKPPVPIPWPPRRRLAAGVD